MSSLHRRTIAAAMIATTSPSSSSSFGTPTKNNMKPSPITQPETKWRTAAQARMYSRRLIDTLRATSSGAPAKPRAVKEAADSALALTARGQSRWSRAILLGRCRPHCKLLLKASGGKAHGCRRRSKAPPPPIPPTFLGGKKMSDRLRMLGRLVPGCRKLSAPSLLEEAADYVAALQMQVKTMRALTDAFAAASLNAAETGR